MSIPSGNAAPGEGTGQGPRDPELERQRRQAKWYLLLLAAILGLYVVEPLVQTTGVGELLRKPIYLAVSIAAVLLVRPTLLERLIGFGLVIPATVLILRSSGAGLSLGYLLSAAFFVFIIVGLMRDVFSHRHVTWGTIAGSMCAYFLIATVFTALYELSLHTLPDAFRGLSEAQAEDETSGVRYFSLVTLTTLGYGDVAPTHTITRMLASMEAVIGQLFLVVAVARLVAVHVSDKRDAR